MQEYHRHREYGILTTGETGRIKQGKLKLIEAEWCIYASAKHADIGSDNGLSPVQHQAIIWSNDAILSIRPLWTHFKRNFAENSKVFIQENALENVACEMAAILSWPQFKNTLRPRQNGSQFVYSISQFIHFFLSKSLQVSLKFVLKCPIDYKAALDLYRWLSARLQYLQCVRYGSLALNFAIMAWWQAGRHWWLRLRAHNMCHPSLMS